MGSNILRGLRGIFEGKKSTAQSSDEGKKNIESSDSGNFLSLPRIEIPKNLEQVIPSDFKTLLDELAGRRAGYEMFPLIEERKEVVTICNKVVEYLHDNQILNLALIDRSARPVYVGVLKLWKKKYPEEPSPHIYFFNPNGFIDDDLALSAGPSGYPRAVELVSVASQSADDIGSMMDFIGKTTKTIRNDFKDTFKQLTEEKDKPLLVFDNCIHMGRASKPILDTLKGMGFSKVTFGVSSNDRNYTDITPDLICLDKTPLGICYPFHPDTLVDKQISSVVSSPTADPQRRAESYRVREELQRIFDEAPASWYE